MLFVRWTAGEAKGFRDEIPSEWFAQAIDQADLEHMVLNPNDGKRYPAKCTLRIEGRTAFLDYTSKPHRQQNKSLDITMGELKIVFGEENLLDIEEVFWRSEGEEFSPAPVVVTDTSLAQDEGDSVLRAHWRLERSRVSILNKIDEVLSSGKTLSCEACGFSFEKKYGKLGSDFCEVHHRVPLHKNGPSKNSTSDLAIVCANCHRMIHLTRPMLTVEEFTSMYIGR